MKTRWVRIAVYNIKLSLYERKRHKSLKKKKKCIHCWRKWQGSIWGILGFWYPSSTALDMALPRGCDLHHITHFQLTGELKCGFSVLHPHRWTQVQTPQSVWVIWIINPYLRLAQRSKKLSSLEKNVFLLRQDHNLFGHNSSKKTIMRYLNKRKKSGTCERRTQDEVDE